MQTRYLFWFLLIVLSFFLALSIVWPKNDFKFGKHKLYFFKLQDLKNEIGLNTSKEHATNKDLGAYVGLMFTGYGNAFSSASNVEVTQSQIDKSRISFSRGSEFAFNELFNSLAFKTGTKLPKRILFYGDSQIEQDRITGSMRQQLQHYEGGAGIGLLPIADCYSKEYNFMLRVSKNWQEINLINNFKQCAASDTSCQPKVGLLFRAFFIEPKLKNSVETGAIKVNSYGASSNPQCNYKVARLFYNAQDSVRLVITNNKVKVTEATLLPSDSIQQFVITFDAAPRNLEFELTTKARCTLHGLSLEDKDGLMVDNIAMRGKKYVDFAKVNRSFFLQMCNLVGVDMVVLYFGVNAAPTLASDYTDYRVALEDDCILLKSILPGVPILLVGVSDMARRSNGKVEDYPNLVLINQTQYSTAQDNGMAFFDLFNAMGGSGSILKWANAVPRLASSDYVHFSAEGAKKVGLMLGRAFLNSYDDYKLKTFLYAE